MAKRCDYCEKGVGKDGWDCHVCMGSGYVQYWETKHYQSGKGIPKSERVPAEKTNTLLGMLVAIVPAIITYLSTQNLIISALVFGVITGISMRIFGFIGKYLLSLMVLAYLAYLLFF